MNNDYSEESLSKLANKAKKKLCKTCNIEENFKLDNSERYSFIKSNRAEDKKKLQKRIALLLKNNPDCIDPIGRLIDHKIYDGLTDSQKQNYILTLSSSYIEICNNL